MEDRLQKFTEDVKSSLDAYLAENATQETIEATQKAADSESGTFEVVITTENLDRYDEVISLDGWQLDHYMKNPVVLWGHDHRQLPIGVATDIRVDDGKMIARGKFALHEFAQTIRTLYDSAVLRATSVGFIEKEREGNLITKAELIEFSFVSVPANPFALSTMVKHGVNVNEMVTKGLLSVDENDGDTVPEETPESESDNIDSDETTEPSEDTSEADSPESLPATTDGDEEEEAPTGEEPTDKPSEPDDKKSFDTKAAEDLKSALHDAIFALEALTKSEEPEGDETPEDEDEKRYKEFSEKRRLIQQAATCIDEVLAEARQAIEAQRAS